MEYFYDYFARQYREGSSGKLFPAAMSQSVGPEDVRNCRRVLKNSFAGYREGRHGNALKRIETVAR